MKLQFRRLTKKTVDHNQNLLLELSPEEQEAITGGGWQSQFFCDAYYQALDENRMEWADIILNTYYS